MKVTRLLLFFFIVLLLFGCSAKVKIMIGTPSAGRVDFHTEITDKEKIERLRYIFENQEEIKEPVDLKQEEADAYVNLQNESFSEISAYIWYQEDGTAITMRPIDHYYMIGEEETKELRALLENEVKK